MPLEVVLNGIIPDEEETAREQVRDLTVEVVVMFVPTIDEAPPAGGEGLAGDDPSAGEGSEASFNTGQ